MNTNRDRVDCQAPHRRQNPLTGDWVLVSPHRMLRPWQGHVEKAQVPQAPEFDPKCYLCPGNPRAGGKTNPAYEGTYVFDNDFPALLPETPAAAEAPLPWKRSRAEAGICRVLCYSPRHDLGLGLLDRPAMEQVAKTWQDQIVDLHSRPGIGYVQIFENRGEIMGCSSPHPHGQIWATRDVPNEVAREAAGQTGYLHDHGICLLCDVLAHELASGERLVCQNDDWCAFVPYWAVWPFELLVLPKKHAACLTTLSDHQQRALAELWQRICVLYDRLFQVPMPLSCGWHIAPKAFATPAAWHVHAHFYPPLLRSATVRKFMVGYEMLAGPQRDLTPEQAAARLRELA